MQTKNHERRHTDRVIFGLNEGLTAALRDEQSTKLRAHVHILNLSEKGMQFTTKSTDRAPFRIDERAIISDLFLNDNKFPNLDIEIVIRWILNPPLLKYIGIGCEFMQMSDTSKESLKKIISLKTNQIS